jgi:glycerol uptake facilitator-like aquaporin
MSKTSFPLSTRLLSEALGTAILVATVVGSGIMAEKLALLWQIFAAGDSQITFSVTHGWSAFGGADHG